ncbi:MAG: hypothetical protein AAGI01_19065, partial [Myxococcota bacterium]
MFALCALAFASLHPARAGAQEAPQENTQGAPQENTPDEDGVVRFEHVRVERVDPSQLPGVRAGTKSRRPVYTRRLPRALTTTQRAAIERQLTPHVLTLATLTTPAKPYRQVPLLSMGVGVWLSASPDGKNPVLVTPAHWVVGAPHIYIASDAYARAASLSAPARSLSAAHYGAEAQAFARDAPSMTRLKVTTSDKHRNLAILTPDPAHTSKSFSA